MAAFERWDGGFAFEMLEDARVRAAQTVEISTRESRWIAPLAIVASHLAHCLPPRVPSGVLERLGALLSGPVDESDTSRSADCSCVLDDLAMGFRCAR